MTDIAIRVQNLSKCYHIYDVPRDRLKQFVAPRLQRVLGQTPKQYFREFWALKDVSFEIKKGETIGIIGRNGSGKSTLLQLICGTLSPTGGSVQTNGRIAALLELGSGFNPEFTGRENVYLNAAVLGLSKDEVDERFADIATFADIGEFVEQPVKTYSSGMLMRLAFATQMALDPNILIVDEALAVGDMSFQIKCFARMNQLRAKGTTILFVSHDLGTVMSFCDCALYLRSGEPVAFGPVADVARQYEQDCLAEKMVPGHSIMFTGTVFPRQKVATASNTTETAQLANVARNYRHCFLSCARKGVREGSHTVTIESFVLVCADGTPVESISPLEEVIGCFLVRFNADFEGCIHLSIQILDKCGSPLAVIRDSHFDETVQGRTNAIFYGAMRFALPVQAGVYYCKVAVLLFPGGGKYSGGRFNFERAEVADFVEHGAHFTVLPFVHHPIPVPVLYESKLTLAHLKEDWA